MPRALEPVAQPRLAAAAVMVLMAASAPAAATPFPRNAARDSFGSRIGSDSTGLPR
jgi:hypothetical protein